MCDLCGSSKGVNLLKSFDRLYRCSSHLFWVIQCVDCGLVYTNPRPDVEEIKDYYPSSTYYAYNTDVTSKGKLADIRAKALNTVLKECYHYPVVPNQEFTPLIRKGVSKLFKSRYMGFPIYKPGMRLLDVGCGDGSFLLKMNEFNFEGYGVELDGSAVRQAKINGLNVSEGFFIPDMFEKEFFDCVRFSHVLEHLPSPRTSLCTAREVMKDNGELIILIPNLGSYFFSVFRKYWFHLDVPRHFYHFTPITIRQLLADCGFSEISILKYTAEQSIIGSLLFLMSGNSELSTKRVNLPRNSLINFILFPVVAICGLFCWGDLLEVRAKKSIKHN